MLLFAFYILFSVSLHFNSLSIVMCVFFYLAINQSYTFNHTFPLSLEINSRGRVFFRRDQIKGQHYQSGVALLSPTGRSQVLNYSAAVLLTQ